MRVDLEHINDSESAKRQNCKLERSNGSVSGKCVKTRQLRSPTSGGDHCTEQVSGGLQKGNTSLVNGIRERLFGWRTRRANEPPSAMCSSSVPGIAIGQMEASTVEKPWRQMVRSEEKPLQTASEEEREMAMLGTSKNVQDDWVFIALDLQQWKAFIHNAGPRAPNKIAVANQGPSARRGSSLHEGKDKIEILENSIAAMGYCRTLDGGFVGSMIPPDDATMGKDLSKSHGVAGRRGVESWPFSLR